MAGILISPSTDKKIMSRNAAMRYKNGLPAFKDVLRQRFRRRIKESRRQLVDKLREVDTSDGLRFALKQEMSDIVSMLDCDSDVQMEDSVIDGNNDTLTDQEAWILHQYNLLLSEDDILQQLYEESLQIVCPLCFKGHLQMNTTASEIVCCACSLTLPARASLPEISIHLSQSVDAHDDSGCGQPLRFLISEEDSFIYLYAVCSSCSFLNLVV